MRSKNISDGLIVEVAGRDHEVQIPGGKKVKIFERNAIALKFGPDSSPNKVVAGGFGRAFTDREAWERAVEEVEKQL